MRVKVQEVVAEKVFFKVKNVGLVCQIGYFSVRIYCQTPNTLEMSGSKTQRPDFEFPIREQSTTCPTVHLGRPISGIVSVETELLRLAGAVEVNRAEE